MLITVVSPVYKSDKIIPELIRRLHSSLSEITSDYEIILVEDGSPDDCWQEIQRACIADNRVKGIKLSRNFGQHHAITAGLDHAKGDWIVVMDCDLQDRPEEIPNLYKMVQDNYDIVFARRIYRQDSFIKRQTSKLFYVLFSYLSGIPQDGTIANFGIYSRKVIDAINSMREPMRAFSPMARWVGYNKTSIEIQHDIRYEGKTSYSWSKLINLALDIALAYSDKPLRMVIKTGLVISGLAIVFAIFNAYLYFKGVIYVTGFASLIISIWFLGGLVIFILGIIGLYLAKVFDGIKSRPLYLVDKKTF